jgi:hypothetical protein
MLKLCSPQFIEFSDDNGNRNLVRVASIQRVCDVDDLQTEAYLTVAGRMILVRASFDQIRDVLLSSLADSRAVASFVR